jgi:hypothetical protein
MNRSNGVPGLWRGLTSCSPAMLSPNKQLSTVMLNFKQMPQLLLCSICLWQFFFSSGSQSQVTQRAIVRGHVVDDSTGVPIPLANVFVVNSKIGTPTDREGRFELTNVPLGSWEVVASIVGYVPAIKSVRLTDSTALQVVFRLKPRAVQMPSVEVVANDPDEWRRRLKTFSEAFFGSSANSPLCRLLNPEVLDFAFDTETKQLTATAREPMKVENKALGYRFQCVSMFSTVKASSFQFSTFVGFEELKPTDDQELTKWQSNRLKAYYGSKRHFLQSLIRKQAKQEGFTANLLGSSWHQEDLRTPFGSEVDPDTLASPGDTPFERRLSFIGLLQVVYSRNGSRQISIIDLQRSSAVIFINGLNPLGIWTRGYWSLQRAAEMLPVDYEPE